MTEQRRALHLLVLGALGSAVMFLCLVVLVRTTRGQRLDDLAFEGRKATHLWSRRAGGAVVGALTVPAVVAGVVAIVVEIVRRRLWVRGGFALAGVASAAVVSQLLKDGLTRLPLDTPAYAGAVNTFPSGHATTVMAVVLAGLVVCGDDLRRRARIPVAVGVVGYTVLLVGTGWHRVSDVAGGTALALGAVATSSAVACWLSARRAPCAAPVAPDAAGLARAAPAATRRDLTAVLLAAVVPAVSVVALQDPPSDPAHQLAPYAIGMAASCAVAAGAVLGLSSVMDGSDADQLRSLETSRR